MRTALEEITGGRPKPTRQFITARLLRLDHCGNLTAAVLASGDRALAFED
jgi:hypothetical protein